MRRIFLGLQRFHIRLPAFWCTSSIGARAKAVSSAANAGFRGAKPAEYATLPTPGMWKFTWIGHRSRIRMVTFRRGS